MTGDGGQDAKPGLRSRLLAGRRAQSPRDRARADARLRATLARAVARLGSPGHSAGDLVSVAAYAPVGAEPGGGGLPATLAHALPPGGRLLLPALRPDYALEWAQYDGRFLAGPHGLAEPAGPRLGVTAVASAALVVVPALAVDTRGVRLGRGGGSYDRALRHVAADADVVALLYDGEFLDTPLPEQPHDRRVTAVVTPTGGWHDLALLAEEC